MSAATTTAQPVFLSTHVFDQDIPPTIADGIAELLKIDRQIIIVTGKNDGRMSGFLADLTHCISRRSSLLRIKSPLSTEELNVSLASQLHMPTTGDSAVQLASRVGHRLQQPAPRGRFVLLCEATDQYPLPTLEAIRQISNYPVSIVLVGSHALNRRLRRGSLKPLRQRITHQLSLNRVGRMIWVGLLALAIGLATLLGSQWDGSWSHPAMEKAAPVNQASTKPVMDEPAPLPIKIGPVVVEQPADPVSQPDQPAVMATPQEPEFRLTLERELSNSPARR